MTVVTRTLRFEAAHTLTGYPGKCRNLHGHTYRVEISVAGEPEGPEGMVIDFKALDRIASAELLDRFDHAFLYDTGSEPEREIAAVVERLGMRTAPLPFRTTSENLARHFYELLEGKLEGLVAVRLWESADSSAEYRKD